MAACAQCGHENPAEARFCNACGAPVAARRAAARGGAQGRHRAVRRPGRLHARARSSWTPRTCARCSRPTTRGCAAELERHGGTVEKFIGDAVMAVFGAPVAHEDDPERAVRAALAIRDWVVEEEPELQVRIAVDTGEALVTLGARPSEGEGMAAGDVVNTAARLQAAAPVNGILVGERTYRATRDAIEYRDGRAGRGEGQGGAGPGLGGGRGRASRFGVDVAPDRRARSSAASASSALLRDALDRARRTSAAPQLVDARRRARHRQEPARVRALAGRRRGAGARSSGGRAARCPTARASPSGRSGRWSRRRRASSRRDPAEVVEAKLAHGGRPPSSASRARPVRVEAHLRPLVGLAGAPEQTGGERRRLAALLRGARRARPGRARVRGPALGRRRHARLRRPPRRLGDGRAAARHLHRAARAARAAAGLGRRQAQRADASRSRRSPSAETARLIGALLARSVLPAEAQSALLARAGGNPLYAEQFVADAASSAARTTSRCPRPCRGSSPPGSTASTRRTRRCSRTPRCSARCSGWAPSPPWPPARRASRSACTRSSARSSSVASGARPSRTRPSTRSSTSSCATSRTARCRAPPVPSGTCSPPGGSSRWAGPPTTRRCSRTTSRARSSSPARQGRARRSSRRARGGRSARPATARCRWGRCRPRPGYYEQALAYCPPGTPERAAVLLRIGRSRPADPALDDALLEEASEGLAAAGDLDGAAEARLLMASNCWVRGSSERVWAQIDAAQALVPEGTISPIRVQILSTVARYAMLGGELERAIEVGGEALEISERLGRADLSARLVLTIGTARADGRGSRGHRRGRAQHRDGRGGQPAEPALERDGQPRVRCCSSGATHGPRAGSTQRSLRVAEASGNAADIEWDRAERITHCYLAGDWREAEERLQAFLGGQRRSRRTTSTASPARSAAASAGPAATSTGRCEDSETQLRARARDQGSAGALPGARPARRHARRGGPARRGAAPRRRAASTSGARARRTRARRPRPTSRGR